jgi:putative two-component system response regulator
LAVLRQLRAAIPEDTYLPIVMMTGGAEPQQRQAALGLGATDFVLKPFDTAETLSRIRNLLETRAMYLQLQQAKARLEERVQERTQEVEQARLELLDRLALAAEYRDDETGQHTVRVGRLVRRLGEGLGLPAAEVEQLHRAAPLHDIGKIGVPDAILLKRGSLTHGEFALIKQHTTIGARILSGSRWPVLRLAEQIALTHHENWDGSGYPTGLRGPDIPLAGRIVAVADVFDSLIHARPYKDPWPVDEATRFLAGQAGWRFDPGVIEVFARLDLTACATPARVLESRVGHTSSVAGRAAGSVS